MKRFFKVFNINWDVDDIEELEGLPKVINVVIEDNNNMDDDDIEEYLSDYITDEYSFCHDGFNYEEDTI